ncbi:MAG TPA: universal stress protein [Longimicrobiales bacterium]|nr:universal stress protein [Longimicrobiales bacterium]
MVKSILIGTNGSRWSETAVKLGISLARQLDVRAALLGVVDVPGVTHGEPLPIGASAFKAERDAKLLAEARERIEHALETAAAQAAQAGVEYSTRFVEGSPEAELGKEVQKHDLLVVGKRAVPHSDHDPAPSRTLTDILHHSPRPVIVAGDEVPDSPSVLVAYDGSRVAARTLAGYVASGIYASNGITVVGVGDDAEVTAEHVQRAVEYLELHGRKPKVEIVPVGGSVSDTLVALARRESVGLMVMGAHGKPRLREMLFGSVTRAILNRVPVPLFLDH